MTGVSVSLSNPCTVVLQRKENPELNKELNCISVISGQQLTGLSFYFFSEPMEVDFLVNGILVGLIPVSSISMVLKAVCLLCNIFAFCQPSRLLMLVVRTIKPREVVVEAVERIIN
ncbi:hypothetical protein AMECASPLE_023076 [Ameca splendens]|uniref:Uncharacterized protein n=1 Tax=Ameca splendens TaxID=208324 RepID=A0ABV0Y3X7_9TELE